jgi:hypothetical protein
MMANKAMVAIALSIGLSVAPSWVVMADEGVVIAEEGAVIAEEGAVIADEATAGAKQASREGTASETPPKPRAKLVPSGGLKEEPPEEILTISGKPVFLPPNRGTPVARVGGAARAMTQDLPGIEALVPLESGLTLEEQPVLYWHLSEETHLPVNFTLIDLNVEAPMVDVTLDGPFDQGVHGVDLGNHEVRLSQGHLYQWFVAIVPDPEDRSSDRLAGGGIELVDMKIWLRMRLDKASPEQVPAILAGAGVWYDALDVLSQRIAANPDDPEPSAQRSALLEQVGLEAVLAME